MASKDTLRYIAVVVELLICTPKLVIVTLEISFQRGVSGFRVMKFAGKSIEHSIPSVIHIVQKNQHVTAPTRKKL